MQYSFAFVMESPSEDDVEGQNATKYESSRRISCACPMYHLHFFHVENGISKHEILLCARGSVPRGLLPS